MVVHPALNRPAKPCALSAERMTAPQKGATSSDQSAVRTSCARREHVSDRGALPQLAPQPPLARVARARLQALRAADAPVVILGAPRREVVRLADAVQQRLLVRRQALLARPQVPGARGRA